MLAQDVKTLDAMEMRQPDSARRLASILCRPLNVSLIATSTFLGNEYAWFRLSIVCLSCVRDAFFQPRGPG